MLRVTADTNIVISPPEFSWKSIADHRYGGGGQIRLVISDDILKEIERVLLRPKFGWTQGQVDDAIRGIVAFAEHVQPELRIDVVKNDPTDNRILECASASGSAYLVSGDKHLLKLCRYQAVKIVTPADFMETHKQPGKRR